MAQKVTRFVTYCTKGQKFDKRITAYNLIWALYGLTVDEFVRRVANGKIHTAVKNAEKPTKRKENE